LFFGKINKVDKPLGTLTKEREKTQINTMTKGTLQEIPMKVEDHERLFLKIYTPKNLENLEKMVTFLGTYDLPKLNQEDKKT
jgi:hypothetical protein